MRQVVRAWDLYNAGEMGGIAVPAVFVIGPDHRVQYRSVDSTTRRVSTAGVLDFLHGEVGAESIEREPVRAGLREFARAIRNAIRVAAEFAQSDLNRRLENGLAHGRASRE